MSSSVPTPPCFALVVLSCFCFVEAQTDWVAACAGGTSASLWVSGDGMNWTTSGVTQPFGTNAARAIAFSASQNRWVATGQGASSTYFSDNGFTWTVVSPSNMFSSSGFGVAFSEQQNLWVLCAGDAPAKTVIWYSRDGMSWNASNIAPSVFSSARAVAFSPVQNRWVAVGQEGESSVAISTNGIDWLGAGPSNMFGSSSVGTGVTYVYTQNVWIATGGPFSPALSIQTSPDGTIWTAVTGSTFSSFGSGIAEGGQPAVVIAVGQSSPGTVLRSTSTSSGWTAVTTGAPFQAAGIMYGQSLWIVAGTSPSIAYSNTNGASWNAATGVSVSDCSSIAVRKKATIILSTGTISGTLISSSFIPAGVAVSVAGNVTIAGDFVVAGSLFFGSDSGLAVTGNFAIAASAQVSVALGASIVVGGTLSVSQSSSLVVLVGGNSVVVTVARYENVSGSFGSVVAFTTESSCGVVSAEPHFGSSVLSVAVDLSCVGGLTVGQIVGIIVGSVVVAALFVVVLFLLGRWLRKSSDKKANTALRDANLTDMRGKE